MRVYRNFPLRKIVYYRIGGVARFLFEVKSLTEIQKALEKIRKLKLERILFLGLGSNLLIDDRPFEGAVIRLLPSGGEPFQKKRAGRIEAFAGERLGEVVDSALSQGLVGLEWSGGLPSTVGAAVRGNVGAFGGEIAKSVRGVQILDTKQPDKGILELLPEQLGFSYRESIIKKNPSWLVVGVSFQLRQASGRQLEEAKRVYFQNIEYRKKRHPLEYPSCGSVFKNITTPSLVAKVLNKWPDLQDQVETVWHGKIPMGYVVERLGLGGKSLGGAQISPKHCNFIVNKGGARFTDVMGLISLVKEKVKKEFGFQPELEIQVVEGKS